MIMMSSAWSWFVILLVAGNIVGIVWLLMVTARKRPEDDKPVETTGHEWDGLQELNMPLPKWWLYLFLITVVFSIVYLILYPGMGNFAGVLNWTQDKEYQTELKQVQADTSQVFVKYQQHSIDDLSQDSNAMSIAERLFANHCSTCHGSDARGAVGFPNLVDDDWLYGGSIEQIQHSIVHGRAGVMPPMEAAVGGDKAVYQLAVYVKSLSQAKQNSHTPNKEHIETGKTLFQQYCSVCHGAEAKGNQTLGAPNLSDDIWLHASGLDDIELTIKKGITGEMPAHKDILSEDEIRFLTAYIYGLSRKAKL